MNAQEIKQIVGGKIFTVTFEKKDGSIRELNGRLGVTKHLKGGKRTVGEDLVVVYDLQKQAYRSFDPKRLIQIKCGGIYR